MRPQLAFAFIFVTVLLDSIGFGIIMPVVPQLIMDVSGDTLTSAARDSGLLMFAYAAMQFIASPVLGNLSDRYGRRPVLLFSLLAMVFNYLLMGWAPTLLWLFVGRIIGGFSASTYGIANAFVADRSDTEMLAFVKTGRPASDPLNTTGVDMPPKGGNPALSDQDLMDVIAHVRTLK